MKIPSWFNQNRFTSIVRFSCAGALISAGVVSAMLALPLSTTGSNPPPAQPQVIDDSRMQALSMTIGGAAPLLTARTVAHWFGTAFNPDNGLPTALTWSAGIRTTAWARPAT
jgi:hypothetical protein